jgi:CxxC-x17-CxxC domain-containing protein
MGFFQKGRSGGKPSTGGKKYGSKPFKKSGFGGGRSYGDRNASKQVYDVICADCGQATTVPFKPNGSKPVLCRDCFRGSEDGPKPRRFERDGGGKRSFDRGPQRSDVSDKRFSELSDKLDLVLEEIAELRGIMMELEVFEEEDGVEEITASPDDLKL